MQHQQQRQQREHSASKAGNIDKFPHQQQPLASTSVNNSRQRVPYETSTYYRRNFCIVTVLCLIRQVSFFVAQQFQPARLLYQNTLNKTGQLFCGSMNLGGVDNFKRVFSTIYNAEFCTFFVNSTDLPSWPVSQSVEFKRYQDLIGAFNWSKIIIFDAITAEMEQFTLMCGLSRLQTIETLCLHGISNMINPVRVWLQDAQVVIPSTLTWASLCIQT